MTEEQCRELADEIADAPEADGALTADLIVKAIQAVQSNHAAEITRLREWGSRKETDELKALAEIDERDADIRQLGRSRPDDIRARGWMVAVHNDYRQVGKLATFWLFTRGGVCIKGEGSTDAEALDEVRAQLPAEAHA